MVESGELLKLSLLVVNLILLFYIFLKGRESDLLNILNGNILKDENIKWAPAGNKIKTIWGENLDKTKVWQEYPRPQLERKEWTNLNGFWDYYIRPKNFSEIGKPDGKILVPFPIESSLSGVMKKITEEEELWYEKNIKIKKEWKDKEHLLLHFGAVDYITEVYINGAFVGKHVGGYTPFYFDIKNFIDFEKYYFTIFVRVNDPTDKGNQAIGKQKLKPYGIYYTPTSGIWQTVWLESLNEYYIKGLNLTSDFDQKQLFMNVELNSNLKLKLLIKIYYNDKLIYTLKDRRSNTNITIQLENKNFYPWSPDEPNLYNIEITLFDNDEEIDFIKTYIGIRKISAEKDGDNIMRFKLNNKVLFHMGTLDQGFFPDGIYTPPSEEAMIFDIKTLKEMGFNTIRKHLKVENARYYYNCDKIGMMVWQDMPSGDYNIKWLDKKKIGGGKDSKRTEESKENYYHEWGEIIDFGKFFPCIVIWIPFNEAWGQFDTKSVVNFTRAKDPTRLINSASGGNHRICGDILDIHNYPNPSYYLKYEGEVNVLGEYGGLGIDIKGHTWLKKNFGYKMFKNKDDITNVYLEYSKKLETLAQEGISGAIYTQTTDCESEINGLITYDRKIIKLDKKKIKEANQHLIYSLRE